MSITFNETVTLVKIECGNCGGVFAISNTFLEAKKRESGGWHCPYCDAHRGYWESNADRLRKELDKAQSYLRAAKCEILCEHNWRIEAERKLKRTKNGVCPCCNRTFQNLQRHMQTKHKDFSEQQSNETR